VFWTQIFPTPPLPQSVLVVHSFLVPGVLVGAAHTPALQTVPRSHSSLETQLFTHPTSVHTWPLAQLAWPEHVAGVGAATFVHP